MIKFKDFTDITHTKKNGALLKNTTPKPNDMLKARVFYDDKWTGPAKGVITYHFGTAGGSFPDINHGLVQSAVPAGYLLLVCIYWKNSPVRYTYNNYFPTHTTTFGALEQQSFLEFIVDRLRLDDVIKTYMNVFTKVIFTGTSKGGGQILAWSNLSDSTSFKAYKDYVVGILSNAPMGGLSGSENGMWSQAMRVLRAQGNILNGVKHQTKVTWPVGDVTHNIRSFSEQLKMFVTNPLVDVGRYGKDLTYGHTWTYSKPKEFMDLAVKMFNEYHGA